MSKQTLVVNLFAGPGAGKSTYAALLYGRLKQEGVNAELVPEYAKDLTWEERKEALANQPYVTAKQIWRIQRLVGKVDVVVTDSPILIGLVYPSEHCTPAWERYVVETHTTLDSLNLFLVRNDHFHRYLEAGRSQTQRQAETKDGEINDMLNRLGVGIYYAHVHEDTLEFIFQTVMAEIARRDGAKALPLCPGCEHEVTEGPPPSDLSGRAWHLNCAKRALSQYNAELP
jgi:hypothetical protein